MPTLNKTHNVCLKYICKSYRGYNVNLITRKLSFIKLFSHTIDFNLKTLDESDPYRFPFNGLSCLIWQVTQDIDE